MTRDERKQLDALSKLVFGSSSKWQKMVNTPQVAMMVEKLENGTERKYKGMSYYTIDEIKTQMQEIWKEELEKQEKEKTDVESEPTTNS